MPAPPHADLEPRGVPFAPDWRRGKPPKPGLYLVAITNAYRKRVVDVAEYGERRASRSAPAHRAWFIPHPVYAWAPLPAPPPLDPEATPVP